MRVILPACACVLASGCELYFGPASEDARGTSEAPDGAVIVGPDAGVEPPPDPPARCSQIAVYVDLTDAGPRGPFLAASLGDALRFYHVPITTAPPSGYSLTIALSTHATDAVEVRSSCMLQIGGVATIADDSARANDEIIANALHGLGVLYSFPPMTDPGDCMASPIVPGCRFGRATTVASDPCGYWEFGLVDEAQMLATDLGCP